MTSIDGFDFPIYINNKIQIIIAYHQGERLILPYLWKEGKKGFEIGSWIQYFSKPENKGIKSIDFLLQNGISLTNISYRYTLIRTETKTNNKFILIDHFLGIHVLGSIFNKSLNELKEDTHIYKFIKYIENKYI